MLIAAVFIIAKTRKQPRCPLVGNQIKKLRYSIQFKNIKEKNLYHLKTKQQQNTGKPKKPSQARRTQRDR